MFQLPVFQYNTLTDFLKTTGWIGCVYWEEQDFIRLLCTIKVSRVIISLNQTMIRARMYLWYVYACVQLISISHYRQTWNITILHTVLLCTNKSDFWLALNSLVPNITKNSALIQFIVTNPFLCEQGKAEKWRCELGTTRENFWIQFQVYHNLCSLLSGRAVRDLYPPQSFTVLPLSSSITNTSNKAWGDAVRWLRMRQV